MAHFQMQIAADLQMQPHLQQQWHCRAVCITHHSLIELCMLWSTHKVVFSVSDTMPIGKITNALLELVCVAHQFLSKL